jgi:predicted 3-demethylubiquinone-9 3-methyltransferase (glyoxalase superfamily)
MQKIVPHLWYNKEAREAMPLGEHLFSKLYGWTQDRYGLSWQLMLVDNGQTVQKITPNFRS